MLVTQWKVGSFQGGETTQTQPTLAEVTTRFSLESENAGIESTLQTDLNIYTTLFA